ncbi:MAG TPA: sigma-54-dependent Fis family transcriptional regulator [Anaeromyxobacter sp.]|nr:sigma-54-dependent Fis family transcriptional regulator [Anaeromyxobacter sp.]
MSEHHGAPSATTSVTGGQLELLQRVTARMTVHHKLDEVLRAVTGGLVQSAAAALARIWLYTTAESCPRCRELPRGDASGGAPSLHLCASTGIFDGDAGPHHCVPLGMFLGGRVAETRQAMLLNDLGSERRVRSLPWIAQHHLQAYAGYPLLFRDELEGVLGIFRVRPFDPGEFQVLGIFAAQAAIAIKNAALLEDAARHHARLSEEKAYLEQEIQQERGSGEIVGRSPALRAVLRKLDQVASADTTVLLFGETGTGKELLARYVHVRSSRHAAPLIRVNCAAIAPGLVESELFGHERGSFTGALERRVGRFELAHGGTLFLDEIGELPIEVQVKLLRALQEGEIERVGSGDPIRVDVRVVAATNRDLEADVAAGRFRADLFYRLNVFPVRVPPLRERPEDLPLLIDHLLAKFRRKLGKPLRLLAPESLDRLRRYAWPGNVRELQNVLERACVLAGGEVVEVVEALRADAPVAAGASLRSLEEVEREHILLVLGSTHGIIQGAHGAARILGLHPNTLRSRMERLGILGAAPRRPR